MTNAMPISAGTIEKNVFSASIPPADAPIPTIRRWRSGTALDPAAWSVTPP